ncbi:hypothetical protein VFPBJ_09849 [Purpureocillium lilacinum]|uniref:Uncharacterized protein n=1 Tax=Purpureocillium lilacinum TaxID=33203 RepID=A0A179G9S0_PURLI|nr:hypothetical protein VFPBJ_09849 [Purpureocillium lilacinum]
MRFRAWKRPRSSSRQAEGRELCFLIVGSAGWTRLRGAAGGFVCDLGFGGVKAPDWTMSSRTAGWRGENVVSPPACGCGRRGVTQGASLLQRCQADARGQRRQGYRSHAAGQGKRAEGGSAVSASKWCLYFVRAAWKGDVVMREEPLIPWVVCHTRCASAFKYKACSKLTRCLRCLRNPGPDASKNPASLAGPQSFGRLRPSLLLQSRLTLPASANRCTSCLAVSFPSRRASLQPRVARPQRLFLDCSSRAQCFVMPLLRVRMYAVRQPATPRPGEPRGAACPVGPLEIDPIQHPTSNSVEARTFGA